MATIQVTEAEKRIILEMVARRWASLVVKSAAGGAKINNPYVEYHYPNPRAQRRKDDSERAMLARLVQKLAGAPLPETDASNFVRPSVTPGWKGQLQYQPSLGRKEAGRLVAEILERPLAEAA